MESKLSDFNVDVQKGFVMGVVQDFKIMQGIRDEVELDYFIKEDKVCFSYFKKGEDHYTITVSLKLDELLETIALKIFEVLNEANEFVIN